MPIQIPAPRYAYYLHNTTDDYYLSSKSAGWYTHKSAEGARFNTLVEAQATLAAAKDKIIATHLEKSYKNRKRKSTTIVVSSEPVPYPMSMKGLRRSWRKFFEAFRQYDKPAMSALDKMATAVFAVENPTQGGRLENVLNAFAYNFDDIVAAKYTNEWRLKMETERFKFDGATIEERFDQFKAIVTYFLRGVERYIRYEVGYRADDPRAAFEIHKFKTQLKLRDDLRECLDWHCDWFEKEREAWFSLSETDQQPLTTKYVYTAPTESTNATHTYTTEVPSV